MKETSVGCPGPKRSTSYRSPQSGGQTTDLVGSRWSHTTAFHVQPLLFLLAWFPSLFFSLSPFLSLSSSPKVLSAALFLYRTTLGKSVHVDDPSCLFKAVRRMEQMLSEYLWKPTFHNYPFLFFLPFPSFAPLALKPLEQNSN